MMWTIPEIQCMFMCPSGSRDRGKLSQATHLSKQKISSLKSNCTRVFFLRVALHVVFKHLVQKTVLYYVQLCVVMICFVIYVTLWKRSTL